MRADGLGARERVRDRRHGFGWPHDRQRAATDDEVAGPVRHADDRVVGCRDANEPLVPDRLQVTARCRGKLHPLGVEPAQELGRRDERRRRGGHRAGRRHL